MMVSYPAIYRDKYGEEKTVIANDGKSLSLVVRGIEFAGKSLDLLDPPESCDKSKLEKFSFFLDALCSFTVEFSVPVLVVSGNGVEKNSLFIYFELGEPDVDHPLRLGRKKMNGTFIEADFSPSKEILRLELDIQNQTFKSNGENSYSTFDEQLESLKKQLPPETYLKICWNCAFSDYHPVGSGSFGDLACFRGMKEEYGKVKEKHALMNLWNQRTEDVQEIYLCPEFQKRKLGYGGIYIG